MWEHCLELKTPMMMTMAMTIATLAKPMLQDFVLFNEVKEIDVGRTNDTDLL